MTERHMEHGWIAKRLLASSLNVGASKKGITNQSTEYLNFHPRLWFLSTLLAILLFMLWPPGASGDPSPAIVAAARAQIGKTLYYDGRYQAIDFPNGDIPLIRGVCTDVVIRALRVALQMDLQLLVHEDMKKQFARYPQIWGLRGPDPNIDHRRVPNLMAFFKRQGWALNITQRHDAYNPGDLVTCTVPPHRPHIMVVSDRTGEGGRPLVIHNIGAGVREEDRLFEFTLSGHYRISQAHYSAR